MKKELVQTFIVAGVVIKRDSKYLLVQEKQPIAYGLWNLPAGRVEKGDTIEETAIKEAREETGYEVELINKIGIYQNSADEPPRHIFRAKISGGKLEFPDAEILDAKWFLYEEIKEMKDKLRGGWIVEAISDLERF